MAVSIRDRALRAATILFALAAVTLGPAASAQAAEEPPVPRVITLDMAVRSAITKHPTLTNFRELDVAQKARVKEAWSGYLPYLNYNLTYTRRTGNCVNQPGVPILCTPPGQTNPATGFTAPGSFDTFNFYNFGVSLNQTIYDFGRTTNGHHAAKEGRVATEQQFWAQRLQVVLDAKTAYYGVLAQQELVKVAQETLDLQKKHLEQAREYFRVGTRTKIDVAQSEADLATAEVNLITTQNNLAQAKLTLLVAMGITRPDTDFTVERRTIEPLPEESLIANPDAPIGASAQDEMLRVATRRPDIRALEAQARQQNELRRQAWSSFLPVLSLSLGASWQGASIDSLGGNLAITVNLSANGAAFGPGWSPFGIKYQVDEYTATMRAAEAAAAKARNDVRLEVETQRLSLIAAKKSVLSAERALVAATERLHLAEGRYQTGAGNIIELSDAQQALASAKATRVQADYNVDIARARLVKALGRE